MFWLIRYIWNITNDMHFDLLIGCTTAKAPKTIIRYVSCIYYINCSGLASGSKSRKMVSHVWIKMISTHVWYHFWPIILQSLPCCNAQWARSKSIFSRNIFGSSSAIFGNLRQSSAIFGNCRKMFGIIRTTFGQHFENFRKSSENGRKSSENRQKHRN